MTSRSALDHKLLTGPLFFWGGSALCLAVDLLSKAWAASALVTDVGLPTPRHLVRDLAGASLSFVLAKNRGAAFGALAQTPDRLRFPFFCLLAVASTAVIVFAWSRSQPRQWALRWALPLTLGGALGNFFDRAVHGYVIDFIDASLTHGGAAHHWPTFNVADITITAGMGLFIIDALSRSSPIPTAPAVSA